jgi:GNAT superfamily N-acetyltransferase
MAATIRLAAIGDANLLAKLNGFVQDVHLEHRPDHFKPTQIAELAGWYRSLLEKSTSRMWIAEQRGVPAGYILAILQHRPETPFAQDRRWCEIDQITVDPKFRRQGIARSLVLKAVADARAEGIHQIEVASWSFNEETHKVFRRLGFAPKIVHFELNAGRERP